MSNLMQNKKGLILGVANDNSISWGVAKVLAAQGAQLAFTYQNEITGKYVIPLFQSVGSRFYEILDITRDEDIKAVFAGLKDHFHGGLDFIVHGIAGGPSREELAHRYIETTKEGFVNSMLISVYSFTTILREAAEMMKGRHASALTMSYYGSDKVVPHYNVMGVAKAALESSVRYLAADLGSWDIRVNAISPGPIRTRAASGIGDFETLTRFAESNAPMHRGVTQEEVGRAALFLLSSLSSGITGEVLFCDAGYNIIGAAFNPAD
ncbi:MAG: enoyl-ACP reductase [Desulfobacteraceae bacterium]